MPDGNEQSLQQFISQSTWDFRSVRERLALRVVPQLSATGQWLLDDTGFPKQGRHSVGVARQYSGTLGKIGNCQIGVSLHFATDAGGIPLDFELYLPEVWTNDPDRCRRAGVPDDTVFQPKWKLGLAMLDRVRGWGVQDQVVGADSGYGKVCEFRDELTQRQLRYVVGVDAETGVWIPPVEVGVRGRRRRNRAPARFDYRDQRPPSVWTVARNLPADAWQTMAWTEGSRHKPLQFRFAVLRVHPSQGYHEGKPLRPLEWLLIEWPVAEPEPTHYWLSTLPETTPLQDLVCQAKWRWHIEQGYRELKDELGLDHFEGRTWIGWHRHVTMTMVGFGFLVLERLRGLERGLI